VRARFCELLAVKVPHGSSDLFLLGLLSLMDASLEIPMSEVLDDGPLDQETGGAIWRGQRAATALSTNAGS
jgi:c-di-GMP-related signal transduction protein